MRTILALFIISGYSVLSAQVTYVNASAEGANDGSSWGDAFTEVRTALSTVSSGDVWVAEGTYYPTAGTDRTVSFDLAPNVNIYGGFPDKGNPTWEDRDWEEHLTILSGDLGAEVDTSENSFKILTLDADSDARNEIDGFTFTGGNSDYDGASIDLSGPFSGSPEAVVRNCTFTDNFADYSGAGITSSRFNLLTVENCVFTGNYAGYEGACIEVSLTNLDILNCRFEDNYADYEGAAISFFAGHDEDNDFSLTCERSIFKNNYADYEGGAIEAWGAVTLNNSLFVNNSSGYEGGVLCLSRYGTLSVNNCTFANNATDRDGSVLSIGSIVLVTPLQAQFNNCVFADNIGNNLIDLGSNVGEVSIEHSFLNACPSGTTCGEGNIYDTQPDFVGTGDFSLMETSACIDAGQNNGIFEDGDLDLAGNNRIAGAAIDMGAYEASGTSNAAEATAPGPVLYPNPVNSELSISGIAGNYQATLINANGQKLSSWQRSGTQGETLNLAAFSPGLYVMVIQQAEMVYSKKIVIN